MSARKPGDELDVRADWVLEPGAMTQTNLDEWYRGDALNVLPTKPKLARAGLEAILTGWLPERPIIGRDTRVIGVGSCFASYFMLWLAENGFNRALDTSPHNALIRFGASFENPAVIAQQFRWAFEGIDSAHLTWLGKDKEIFEATEERRALVRRTLEQTDVLVLTLGLSEVWYDRVSGEPLWRALTRRHYDPQRHVFRVETMRETKAALETIESLREKHLPNMKIVFTVSPVRLKATFRPVSAVTANSVSKAILRASVDEFLRESGKLNRLLFYFPSYEIVHDFFRDAFEEDNRHVTPFTAAQVVRCFASHYCDVAAIAVPEAAPGDMASEHHARFLALAGESIGDPSSQESITRIAQLEKTVEELQGVCDERQKVIKELDQAARERLALVEKLHTECAALQRQLADTRGRR